MLNLVFYTAKNCIWRFKHNDVMYVTEDYIGLFMSLLSYYKPTPFYALDRLLSANPDIDRIYVISKDKSPYIYKGQGKIEYVCDNY